MPFYLTNLKEFDIRARVTASEALLKGFEQLQHPTKYSSSLFIQF